MSFLRCFQNLKHSMVGQVMRTMLEVFPTSPFIMKTSANAKLSTHERQLTGALSASLPDANQSDGKRNSPASANCLRNHP